MTSSKASKHFQNLEMGCPSFPQKLKVSIDFFLVLEEDSVDFEEDLPLEGLAGGLGSIFGVSFFGLGFLFLFPLRRLSNQCLVRRAKSINLMEFFLFPCQPITEFHKRMHLMSVVQASIVE